MTREEIVKEKLIKTDHSLGFAISALQEALQHSTHVESILILRLIEDAAKLNQRVNELRGAV